MKLTLITNADAGSAEKETIDEVVQVLSAGAEVDVVATSDQGELTDVLGRARSTPGKPLVVVAGGDGSLHAVVQVLHDHDALDAVRLGLVPLGTGNDFARGQQIPLEPAEAARVLLHGEERPVDLLVDDEGRVVVNNVHAGASAQASRRGARWKERLGKAGIGKVNLGKLGYPVGAALAAVRPPFVRLSVEVDDEPVIRSGRRVLMVSVGNSSHIGAGTEVTPDADVEDGKADVMVSLAVGPVARFTYTAQMRWGRHTERRDVVTVRGRKISVRGEEFYCSADGEIDGPVSRRTWTLREQALTMVLPTPEQRVAPN